MERVTIPPEHLRLALALTDARGVLAGALEELETAVEDLTYCVDGGDDPHSDIARLMTNIGEVAQLSTAAHLFYRLAVASGMPDDLALAILRGALVEYEETGDP